MSLLPVDELLAPLGDDAPCGPDLEYDPAFLALEEASRGKPEQQFGDTVIAAEDADWRAVYEGARGLAERTRDLRVAVLLARSAARLHGVAGYNDALALIAGLLEQHWDHVYPLLDADDNNDPTMRLNALAPLVDGATGLADFRTASVLGGRSPLTVRQIELAAGKADPRSDESVPSEGAILDALAQGQANDGELLARLKRPQAELQRIDAVLTDKVGSEGPDLKPLQLLTRWVANAAAEAEAAASGAAAEGSSDAGADGHGDDTGGASTSRVATPGSLRNRDDVIKTLDRVCDWIEKNEPTNPAPLLIRRAQRLMTKNFMDIIRDIAPDGFAQIENLAGRIDE
jgi:type VI secretion system protein ImpA